MAAPTQASINQVQSMYVAYYGRPGDPAGLNYWAERLDDESGNLDAIVDSFGNSSEFQTRYGNLSSSELISQVYENVLGRAADTAGLNYYVDQLEQNSSVTLASIAKVIWDGSSGDDVAITSNKLTVAKYFTEQVVSNYKDYSDDDIADATVLLSSVDSSSDSAAQPKVDTLIRNLTDRGPNQYEQYMLELINEARANPEGVAAELGVNLNEGLDEGVVLSASQPLVFNDDLLEAAWDHNFWMLQEDELTHTGEGDSSLEVRLEQAGYAANISGENLAVTGSSSGISSAEMNAFTERLFENLFKDEGVAGHEHRVNMLNGDFTEVGVAVDVGQFEFIANSPFTSVITTQDFAAPVEGSARGSGEATLLGVVFDDQDGDGFYDPGEGRGGVKISIYSVDSQGQTSDVAVVDPVTTWGAGGYQIELEAGKWDVFFTDASGANHLVGDNVVISQDNIKLDWII